MICRLNIFILFSLLSIVSSCTQDAYDKGEGKYSLMRGDFVEAQIDASKQIVSITTDDDEMLPLVNPYSANWITKGDTLYRCMLYYNKVETAKGKYAAEVLSVGQVPCPSLKHWADFKEKYRTDPVKFESLWLSKSGKYLNLYMLLKTGVTEDTTAVHRWSITMRRAPTISFCITTRTKCLSIIPRKFTSVSPFQPSLPIL